MHKFSNIIRGPGYGSLNVSALSTLLPGEFFDTDSVIAVRNGVAIGLVELRDIADTWDPSELGVSQFLLDPSIFDQMFLDEARTTPAVADGTEQAIKGIAAGVGSNDFVQATDGRRPRTNSANRVEGRTYLEFDADFLNLDSGVAFGTTWTVGCVIRVRSLSAANWIIGGVTDGLAIGVNTDGEVVVTKINASSANTTDVVPTNEWVTLIVTYETTAGTRVFINGVEDNPSYTGVNFSANTTQIGRTDGAETEALDIAYLCPLPTVLNTAQLGQLQDYLNARVPA